jgi:hypothetical protein
MSAGSINRIPFTGGLHGIPIFRPGTTEFKLNNSALAPYLFMISPGYLDTAGTRLLGGRDVSRHDTAKSPHVAIVNQTFARKMWSGAPAIGQHFIVSGNLTEVVGLAEDGKYHDLEESPHLPCICRCRKLIRARRFSWCGRGGCRARWRGLRRTLNAIAPNRVSGEPERSGRDRRRSVDDGSARHGSFRHSGPTSTLGRSIPTHAG